MDCVEVTGQARSSRHHQRVFVALYGCIHIGVLPGVPSSAKHDRPSMPITYGPPLCRSILWLLFEDIPWQLAAVFAEEHAVIN